MFHKVFKEFPSNCLNIVYFLVIRQIFTRYLIRFVSPKTKTKCQVLIMLNFLNNKKFYLKKIFKKLKTIKNNKRFITFLSCFESNLLRTGS